MLIYAHRGASFDYPEMSRAAYLAAVEQGADGFECDLRLTKDRALVCWHDADLMRIAASPLKIATSTLAELRTVTEILTFEELLEIALTHKKHLALETKHPVPTRGEVERVLLKTLDEFGSRIYEAKIEIAIMSFSWWAIKRIQFTEYEGVFLIAHRWQSLFNSFDSIGPGLSLLRKYPKLARTLTRDHRRLFVWTVNTKEDLELVFNSGADVVMTDKPHEMKDHSKWLKP